MLSQDEQRKHSFTRIYQSNHWGSDESCSGRGSELATTRSIRSGLARVLVDFNVTSMLDVPCGDFNWMNTMNLDGFGVDYQGVDIVSDLVEVNNVKYGKPGIVFDVLDAVIQQVPTVDLIFCRDMLQYLPTAEVWEVLKNFEASGSKYLLVTSYNNRDKNDRDIQVGGYRPLSLFCDPFRLGTPIRVIFEGSKDSKETGKAMYLMDLKNIWRNG